MKNHQLGSQGLMVPSIGLGCMGMAGSAIQYIYGKSDDNEAISVIHRSLELGGNFLDTAEVYGPLVNERLIAKAIKGNRDKYILATKFGFEIDDQEQITGKLNGGKAYMRKAVERSLKNLGTDYIDLYYLHRQDPNTPIEETVEAMAELVKEGKIGYIGLSEVSADTIRKAHAVYPLTAVETEYSIFERDIEENGILKAMQELGIGLVAYSPLGRGFLSGELKSPDDFEANDSRKILPRFQGENFYKNLELVKEIEKLAATKGITAAQLALAYIVAKGHTPIPGTRRLKYLEQNMQAGDVTLSKAEIQQIGSVIPLGAAIGDRYDKGMQQIINQ